MFTGIVDHFGKISRIESGEKKRLWIISSFVDIEEGESISVDGICLTAVSPQGGLFCVDISPETQQLTTATYYREEVIVNLERSLRLSDRLGGHFVMGHIDQRCWVSQIAQHGEYLAIDFRGVNADCKSFLVKKGSIAINGVSLTINLVHEEGFQVMLIPHTLKKTNLSSLKLDQEVNIEYDYFAKLIMNHLKEVTHA